MAGETKKRKALPMLFKKIAAMDENGSFIPAAYVGVRGDRIAYIGEEEPDEDFGEACEGAGKLLMPGFFNAHAHSPMAIMRGYAENLRLQDWLNKKIFPFEDLLEGEDVYHANMLAMAESFRYGIVSTSDMYFFTSDMARSAIDCGAKANIGRSLVSFDAGEDLKDNKAFGEAEELRLSFDGADGGRIVADMSLHAEYTSTRRLVRQLAEHAQAHGAAMQVHVSETWEEHESCKQRHDGKTPVEYFASEGLLDVRTTAAHCVWVEDRDMEILAEKGSTVASCPASNLKIASGVCNVPALMGKGVKVALGTDGAASNNSLNMLGDMKLFALLSKERHNDPTLITPRDAIYAATRHGALSQGREDSGRLGEGCKADLIVLDITGPHMQPVYDMATSLVYSASGSDVCMTMVDGRTVYRDGDWPTIDMERAVYEVNRTKDRIVRELKI